MTTVTTYRLAYLSDHEVTLCDACVERGDHGLGSLGPVAVGRHRGECDGRHHSSSQVHRHRVARTNSTRAYQGPVNPRRSNPAAHGNVQVTDHCICGATRPRLINGRHEEIGEWEP